MEVTTPLQPDIVVTYLVPESLSGSIISVIGSLLVSLLARKKTRASRRRRA